MTHQGHTFHDIYLHFNWHRHQDRPLITDLLEQPLHDYVAQYSRKFRGVEFLAIGGTATHLHLAVKIEPQVCASEFIGKIKGASSHEMNRLRGGNEFRWQRGYGVVSFARRNLPAVVRYVENQKAHHAQGTVRAALETSGDWGLDDEG